MALKYVPTTSNTDQRRSKQDQVELAAELWTELEKKSSCSPTRLEAILKRGGDANYFGGPDSKRTPLTYCAFFCLPAEAVKVLLSHGANPNLKDNDGRTPLHWAADVGRTEIVEALIAHPDTNPNLKDKFGFTPLHYAAMKKDHPESAKALIAHSDTNPNLKDKNGKIPLHTAAEYGQTEIVEMLIAHHDTDVQKRDDKRRTAYDIAANRNNMRITRMLANADVIAQNGNNGCFDGRQFAGGFDGWKIVVTQLRRKCGLWHADEMLFKAWGSVLVMDFWSCYRLHESKYKSHMHNTLFTISLVSNCVGLVLLTMATFGGRLCKTEEWAGEPSARLWAAVLDLILEDLVQVFVLVTFATLEWEKWTDWERTVLVLQLAGVLTFALGHVYHALRTVFRSDVEKYYYIQEQSCFTLSNCCLIRCLRNCIWSIEGHRIDGIKRPQPHDTHPESHAPTSSHCCYRRWEYSATEYKGEYKVTECCCNFKLQIPHFVNSELQ